MNEYRRRIEQSRLLRLQDERRRQEAIVHSYRSRMTGAGTDSSLDRDLLSILSDSLSNSRGTSVGLTPDVEVINTTDWGSTSSAAAKPMPAGYSSASELMSSLVNRRPELSELVDLVSPVKPSTSSADKSDKSKPK